MLGIMAGMDQEAWFAGFDVVPRAVLLLVSQAPDARHHGRLGPQDSVEVHRFSSWTRFSPCPLLCYVCLGPDSVLHSGVSAVAVLHGLRCCFHAVFPFIVGRPVLPSVYTAWTIAGVQFLDKLFSPVVVHARCRLCPGSAQRCPWRHYRCSSWTRSWSLRQMPWPRQFARSLQGRRLLCLRQFPVVRETPQLFSLVVGVPVVLMQQVVPCPW